MTEQILMTQFELSSRWKLSQRVLSGIFSLSKLPMTLPS